MTYITPSINLKAFSCPHCGAYADQHWQNVFVKSLDDAPGVWTKELFDERIAEAKRDHSTRGEKTVVSILEEFVKPLLSGKARLGEKYESEYVKTLKNVQVSVCHSCKDIAIWRYDKLIDPVVEISIKPNSDLPDEVKEDFVEAQSILKLSPRGSAALSRLAIDKLRKHLGYVDGSIDDAIGKMVQDGLPTKIKEALDAVRVIGNNAVHVLELDFRDDVAIATTLLELINIICDRLISEPNKIDAIYSALPTKAAEAIQKRDEKLAKKA